MDALVRRGDDDLDAEEQRALGSPVARGTRTVLTARDDDQRDALGLVALGGVVDRHDLARRLVRGQAALRAGDELVAQADVRERATHHHLVIAAARAVRVELALLDAVLEQPAAGGTVGLDHAGGGDVVGRDRVAEYGQGTHAVDVREVARLGGHAGEERRLAHVRRVGVPVHRLAGRGHEGAPVLVAVPDRAVLLLVEILGQRRGDDLLDLLHRRPDVGEHHVVALAVGTDRLRREIDVERAGERVRDHERGRGEVRGAHLRMHAALEVAVAREDGADGELVLGDGGVEGLGQRARVADARRAAVADEVEAQLVERAREASTVEVVGDDAGARREAGLDPRLRLEALGAGVARHQTGGDHHGRVRRVGARGDCGNHDAAVIDGAVLGGRRGARGLGRDERLHGNADGRRLAREGLLEALADAAKINAVLRAAGAGKARDDLVQVEHEHVGIRGERLAVLAEHALRATVRLGHSGLGLTPGGVEEADRLGINREGRGRGAELRCHVRQRRAVRDRERAEAITAELDVAADDAVLAQALGDGEDKVGGGDARVERAAEFEANHDRLAHRERLTEHRGLGLDAADAPAEHAERIDHRRVRVGADERVG